MRPVLRTAVALGAASAGLSTGVAMAWSDYGSGSIQIGEAAGTTGRMPTS